VARQDTPVDQLDIQDELDNLLARKGHLTGLIPEEAIRSYSIQCPQVRGLEDSYPCAPGVRP
jgi:hypothetical protein